MYVDFGENMTIVNNNNLATVMHIALGAMTFNLLVILYFFPVEVFNHAKNKRHFCYLCQPAFWRTCCRDQDEVEVAWLDDESESL